MTEEEKLFSKISDEITKKFESIGDAKVREAVQKSFETYKESYSEKTEAEMVALKAKMDELNKSFEGLNEDQTKEFASQLGKIETQLTAFESTLKKIGDEVSRGKMGIDRNGNKSNFEQGIYDFLSAKLPNEEGKVIYEAMEGMSLSSQALGNLDTVNKSNGNVAVLSASSMFAAIDHTNANSTSGQAQSRDMMAMGFKNIPPILNDHVADIFTTPKLGKNAFMTIRIFHTFVDGAAVKVEGTGTFAKSSVQLKSQDYKVFTFGTQYRISVEESEDVPEIAAELNSVIPDRLMDALDDLIWTDGGDNSATPWGALNTTATIPNATAFNPYIYAGSNANADVADLVAKMKLYAKSQNYRANAVVANDSFFDDYTGLRDDNGNSLQDRRVTFANGVITGMSGLTTKQTLKLNETAVFVTSTPSEILGIRDNIMMQVGLNADDFATHNISTKWWGRFAYGAKDALANIYEANYPAAIAILKMSAATALTYTDEVAKGTAGYDQANITIALLKTAGGTSLIDANETAYQVAIEAAAGVATIAALQVIIDAVNAA